MVGNQTLLSGDIELIKIRRRVCYPALVSATWTERTS